ncbi:MAG TPA: hypothetical protein VFQ25_02180 [Ktedonobacterales bacterium]|nr:hypothetical protein [Ktedonobacterales bacterium]
MIRALLSMALMALQYFMAARQPADAEPAGASEPEAPGAGKPAHDAADTESAASAPGQREERR